MKIRGIVILWAVLFVLSLPGRGFEKLCEKFDRWLDRHI